MKIIFEGKATCRLHRKSPKESNKNSQWTAAVTILALVTGQAFPGPVFRVSSYEDDMTCLLFRWPQYSRRAVPLVTFCICTCSTLSPPSLAVSVRSSGSCGLTSSVTHTARQPRAVSKIRCDDSNRRQPEQSSLMPGHRRHQQEQTSLIAQPGLRIQVSFTQQVSPPPPPPPNQLNITLTQRARGPARTASAFYYRRGAHASCSCLKREEGDLYTLERHV